MARTYRRADAAALPAATRGAGERTRRKPQLELDQTALLVPLDAVVPGQNARTNWDVVDERLKQLAASIQEQGILEPLLVREMGTRSSAAGRVFQLVAGFRRYTAARYLNLSRVPVRVLPAADDETVALNLAENLAREGLPEADAIRGVEQLQDTYGWGVRKISRVTGRSVGWVSELLAVARCRPEREAVERGQLSLGAAARLVRLRKEAPAVHGELMARLAAGERVAIEDVPRVRQLHPVPDPSPGQAPDQAPPPPAPAAALLSPARPLELGPQELSLYRNMYLTVRHVLATISIIWDKQGPDRTLPADLRRELVATQREIAAFLSRDLPAGGEEPGLAP